MIATVIPCASSTEENSNPVVDQQSGEVSNTGGVLEGVDALLMIVGGAGTNDTVSLDDTGNDGSESVTITDTTVSGLGMSGSIVYSRIEDLDIALGSGGNTATIASTERDTTTTLRRSFLAELATSFMRRENPLVVVNLSRFARRQNR